MLKTLRRKFILSIMLLAGIVMLALLATTAAGTQASLDEIVERSLASALETDASAPSSIEMGHLPVLWVDLTRDGVTVATNEQALAVDAGNLDEVLSQAMRSNGDAGRLDGHHLSWKRAKTPRGSVRIAIADTSAIDAVRVTQVKRDVALAVLGMLVLFGIASALARWATQPVECAWDQQRRFVADASHELKTPLAVIAANAQILSSEPGLAPGAERWVRSTLDETVRMRGLIEDMLELARIEQPGTARTEPVDMTGVVDGIALQFDAVAFERGCDVARDLAPGVVVMGDAAQLERLVKILLDNACKYSEPSTTVSVSLKAAGGSAQLSVTNQGTPIDPEDLPHLFERFYRSDKARDRKTGGYGLGLAIAKGICEQHGGSIATTSTQADGTTFVARIPLARGRVRA